MNSKQRKQRKWLFLALCLVLLTGCEKVVYEPIVIPNNDLSFATDIQPILNANCVTCHPPTKGLDLTAAHSYNSLVPKYVSAPDSANPEASKLYLKMVGSHNARTTDVEKQKLVKWISQGAPNN